MSVAYGANATDLRVHSDGQTVSVYTGARCVLSFDHPDPDEAAYVLAQLVTTEHGRSFDRID